MEETISEAFVKVVDLCLALGYENIAARPDALVLKIDDNWTIAMHGHKEPMDVPEGKGCMGIKGLPGCAVAIWWNGWIAGMVNAGDGAIAFGEMANEDTFIAAVEAATAKAKEAKKNVDLKEAP